MSKQLLRVNVLTEEVAMTWKIHWNATVLKTNLPTPMVELKVWK